MYTQSSWNWKKEKNHSKDFVYPHICFVLPAEAVAGDAFAVFTFFQHVGS